MKNEGYNDYELDYADNFEKENILEYIEDLFIYVDEKYKKR